MTSPAATSYSAATQRRPYLLLGILLVLMPVTFLVCYTILGAVFGYPGDRRPVRS